MERDDSLSENRRFGEYLRKVREDRKLSLDSVEEMTVGYPERITKSHLSRIENGQAVPTFPRMFALGEIYGVPISCLAERFEMELRRKMTPADLALQSDEVILKTGKELRGCGRYAEALQFYEQLLDRWSSQRASVKGKLGKLIDLRLERATCLIHLGRYAVAKDESENLLNAESLTPDQRAAALQQFSISCYRLGKYSIALMALQSAEAELKSKQISVLLTATLVTIKGNLFTVVGRSRDAIPLYREAIQKYEGIPAPFEACRARLNLCSAQITIDDHKNARKHLMLVLQQAENHGFDRLAAVAQSNLAVIAFKEGNLSAAESHCLRSNSIARPREYATVIYRNCYYLWRIAIERDDKAGIRTHERCLRTYLGRVDEPLPEADAYRAYLAGSESC